MHFYNLIKELSSNKKIVLFVDMDGVISPFEFDKPFDFANKRPMTTNIKTLEKVSKLKNVDINILSVCRKDIQKEEKNIWLDKNAPFFTKEKRNIISKENIVGYSSAELKAKFLKEYKTNDQIVLVDDDVKVLKTVSSVMDNVILFQDSELVD